MDVYYKSEDNGFDSKQKLGFGKHANLIWAEAPQDYLVWIYENMNGDRRALAEQELEKRSNKSKAV